MSKSEKPNKGDNTAYLKRELSQASKLLQNLKDGLDQIEEALVDSNATRARMSKLQEELADLRKRLSEAEEEQDNRRQSFTTSTHELTKGFDTQLKEMAADYESKLKERQQWELDQQKKWQQEINSYKIRIDRLSQKETTARSELEAKLKEAENSCRNKEDELSTKLKGKEGRITELSNENQKLKEDLKEHRDMLKGRETERARLENRLRVIEAFSPSSLNG